MGEKVYERTLEETPTWAVAVVCFVLLFISIIIEHIIHAIGKWFKKTNKKALYEALEKVKGELMLLGFLSFLLTVFQEPISKICVSKNVGSSWHPCTTPKASKTEKHYDDTNSRKLLQYLEPMHRRGKVAFVSAYGIHEIHIFIFVLAIFHILQCIITLTLGRTKMRRWKTWEDETKTIEYQYYNDPERFRFARDTTFGRRHLNKWSESSISLWMVCFFRQFIGSISKVDYFALRHGFIMAHLAPGSDARFDFQKYINRSLEEDFNVVVGITLWFFTVLFLLTNTHGWYSQFWLPFIPFIIVLLVGAKLQMIITKMGLKIQDRGEVVRGAPLVQPGDELFWFNRPRFLLFLIHLVLFQYEFTLYSCFHGTTADIVIRVTMGVVVQILCSYVTLPLYALVTQMGSTMKHTIFNDRVATALKSWHHTAKKHVKDSKHASATPFSSRPATPTHGLSPVHLLYRHHGRSDSTQTSPRTSNYENEEWGIEGSASPSNYNTISIGEGYETQMQVLEPDSTTQLPVSSQNEISISVSDFSFEKQHIDRDYE
ncbi:hypothetical protein Lal_00028497 [Lupinus albus]|nr:hypothetical protein Lal_00028497 [Lupinus albus]